MAANPRGFVFLARSSGATCALLRYLAPMTHPTIVWSQWRGYLDKGGPVPSFCAEHSIDPIVIHSGGHAHPKDLADLARRIHPGAVVPIHTEAALHFAAFISNVRVVTDGEAVEVASLIADYDWEANAGNGVGSPQLTE